MSAPKIIDRGRGPELVGTRVTVYRVMDFVKDGSDAASIAAELELSPEQVQTALDYIAAHREEVEAEYERILKRVHQSNPDWVEADAPKTPEELRRRILSRRAAGITNAHPSRQ